MAALSEPFPARYYMPHEYPCDETRVAVTEPAPAERDTLPPSALEEEAARKNSTTIPPGTDIERAIQVIAEASREMRGIRSDIADGFRSQGAQLGAIQRELRRVNQRVTDLEAEQSELRAELLTIKRRLRRTLRRIAALEARKEDSHAANPSAPPAG
jgi:chromosome segregation ATPase